jgi:hypothetical protein
MSFHVPEKYRLRNGPMGSESYYGNNGAFFIPINRKKICVIASDCEGWEHVSVSLKNRCPAWGEMCQIKSMFWDDEDCVVQFHPPKSDYINCNPYCLHLWRPVGVSVPRPPKWMVGV